MNTGTLSILILLAISGCGAPATGDGAEQGDEATTSNGDGDSGNGDADIESDDGTTTETDDGETSEADSAETSESDSSETDSDSSETDGETGDVPDVEYAEGIEVIDLCVTLEASCALRPDSSIVCWGVPWDLSGEYSGLSEDCGLAITQAGEVVDLDEAGIEYGFDDPPYVEIATIGAANGVCSRRADGIVDCWSMWGPEDGATPPAAGPAARISAGGRLACLLRPTGEVACWNFWATEVLDYACQLEAAPPPGAYEDIDVGCAYTLAVGEDGRVYRWSADDLTLTEETVFGQDNAKVRGGSSWDGYLGVLKNDGTILRYDGQPAVAGVYSAFAISDEHGCAIRADNNHVVCWGKNDHGQSLPPTE